MLLMFPFASVFLLIVSLVDFEKYEFMLVEEFDSFSKQCYNRIQFCFLVV